MTTKKKRKTVKQVAKEIEELVEGLKADDVESESEESLKEEKTESVVSDDVKKNETNMDLPLADMETPWDGPKAKIELRDYATNDDDEIDWNRYGEGFFYCDKNYEENMNSYKLPFAKLIDGRLMAVPRGIFAAAAAMAGARGGVDIPDDEREAVMEKIGEYYLKMDREPPFMTTEKGIVINIEELGKDFADFVSPRGDDDSKLVFVSASPSRLEILRQKPLVGPTGKVFEEAFLKSLGRTRDDVKIVHAVPVLLTDDDGKDRTPTSDEFKIWKNWLSEEVKSCDHVVALGKIAKTLLGDKADFTLPHPKALLLFGDSGEVERKTKAIKKQLNENKIAKSVSVNIVKRDEDKRIVYGIVLEPDSVDLQNDVVSKSEIETAAHEFLKSYRVVGDNHNQLAKADVVESYIATSDGVLNGKPFKAGSWMMAVKVDDEDMWLRLKEGEYTGFSIGGSAERIDL